MNTNFKDLSGLPYRMIATPIDRQASGNGPDAGCCLDVNLMLSPAQGSDGLPHLPDDLSDMLLVLVPQTRSADRKRSAGTDFQLTRAELEVARAVAEGLRTEAIARLRGTSVNTVRNQIKAAMEKCGVSRQLDLARSIRSLDG